MKLRLTYLLALLLICSLSPAQNDPAELVSAVLGAASAEELDEEMMEHYESVLARKVAINLLPPSRLRSTGLFSRYQLASLTDYISRNGDVLSAAELCLVDGFSRDFVERIAPFISFSSSARPGQSSREQAPHEGEFLVRTAAKRQGGAAALSYASKLKLEGLRGFDAGLTVKAPYGEGIKSEAVSGYLSWHGRRYLNQLTIGDYHTRFGQGLLLWSGFSLSGFSSAAAFARHPGGLSQAYTTSPSTARRGAAAELQFGHLVTSLMYDISGYAAVNATFLAHRGQLGLTVLSDASASADARWSFGKWDFFGECAYSLNGNTVAAVAGLTFNPAYQKRVSLLLRHYPPGYQVKTASGPRSSTKTSDESGLAVAVDMPSWTLSADAAYHPSKQTSQFKAVFRHSRQPYPWLSLDLKGTARYRPKDAAPFRGELRPSAIAAGGPWQLKTVIALCTCRELAWLASVEGG